VQIKKPGIKSGLVETTEETNLQNPEQKGTLRKKYKLKRGGEAIKKKYK
jgi:hypothetical protein